MLKENVADFINKTGKKIITTHISDCDFINERHWLPAEGKIDWAATIKAFDNVGYNGCWLYEIDFAPPWSIERSRNLTCADLKNNYNALMQGKEPFKIGKPKNNLGMWNTI